MVALETIQTNQVVQNFIETVRSYCKLIENRKGFSLSQFLESLEMSLLELYRLVQMLPDVSDLIEVDEIDIIINRHLLDKPKDSLGVCRVITA